MKLKPLEILDSYVTELNPLQGLTLREAHELIADGDRGYYSLLTWCYRHIEKRDAVLRAAKYRIRAAVGRLDWDIKLVSRLPRDMQTLAEKQAIALRDAYERIDNLEEAKKHLVSAQFRGFAHLEKHVNADGDVIHLEPVPQWHWVRKGLTGEWKFNADARMGVRDGQAIDRSRFIIREVEDPIDEIALLAHVDKELAKAGWSKAVKRHGLPFVFWVMSEAVAGTLVNDPQKLEAWRQVMAQVCNDATGMFPGGDVKMLDISNNGSLPHESRIRNLNEEIVIAATSGKLTMLNEATGLGSGNAQEHGNTFDELASDLAKEISEDFQKQFDAPLLAELFPGAPRLAYFAIAATDAEDVQVYIQNVKALHEAGYHIPAQEVAEKTGYDVQDATMPASQSGTPPRKAQSANRGSMAATVDRRELIAAAAAEDFRPLREQLENLLAIEDDAAFVRRAAEMSEALPGLYVQMLAEAGALSEVLTQTTFETMAAAVTEAAATTATSRI